MKRLLSSWQGLLAGLIAICLFLISTPLIRAIDPTAGAFDAGFLQWILLGTVAYFWGVFVTWAGWQIAFRSIDALMDEQGYTQSLFSTLSAPVQYAWIQGTFILMGVAWFVALKLVPI